ncbi:condensation domain-containing protein [Chryseolinea lacunae]|uniref:AMP-binding protein n=1 Tax=Chryseolinea lacunae TaxID=2801331 RepID=A0ABS1KUF8_9BACT|nr:condensation domain-containing protein [Chryseolinea lacunae]MBL0743086.1 AMP-binding protein [Chryseolinea lacunae]
MLFSEFDNIIRNNPQHTAIVHGHRTTSYGDLQQFQKKMELVFAQGTTPCGPVALAVNDPVCLVAAMTSLMRMGIQVRPFYHFNDDYIRCAIEASGLDTVVTDGDLVIAQVKSVKVNMNSSMFTVSGKIESRTTITNVFDDAALVVTQLFIDPESGSREVAIALPEIETFCEALRGRLSITPSAAAGMFETNDPIAVVNYVLPFILSGSRITFYSPEETSQDYYGRLVTHSITHVVVNSGVLRGLVDAPFFDSKENAAIKWVLQPHDFNGHLSKGDNDRLQHIFPALSGVAIVFPILNSGLPQCIRISTRDNNSFSNNIIGKSIASGQLVILDNRLKPVPPDVVGSLYVRQHMGGNGKDRQRFVAVQSPAGGEIFLYKTNHRARYSSDKTVEIVEFNPAEVVVDGQIAGIGYLNRVLAEANAGRDVKVLVKANAEKTTLVCFFAHHHTDVAGEAFRQRLASVVPAAWRARMQFVALPALPTTSTGDVDINKLLCIDLVDAVVEHIADALKAVGLETFSVFKKVSGNGRSEHSMAARESVDTTLPVGNGAHRSEWPIKEDNPAILRGENLGIPVKDRMSLGALLVRTAEQYPDKGITFVNKKNEEEFLSYATLLEESLIISNGLQKNRILPGDNVILQVKDTRNFFTIFWGCILRGVAPLAIGPIAVGSKSNALATRLHQAWNILNRPAILSDGLLREPLAEMETSFATGALRIIDMSALDGDQACGAHESSIEDNAFLLLTSGSTGIPKCIPVKHKAAFAHIFGVKKHIDADASDVIVNILPIDHITPLLTMHVRGVVTGAQQVHLATELFIEDPLTWFDTLERYKGTHTFSPNFAYKLTLDKLQTIADRHWDLSSVRYFKNGGELVHYNIADKFFQHVAPFGATKEKFQPAYGMTEAAGAVTLTKTFANDQVYHMKSGTMGADPVRCAARRTNEMTFMAVGGPLPEVTIRIVDEKDRLCSIGEVGRIQIMGTAVTSGYLNNDVANATLFADGWLSTGDLGFIKENSLVVTGREKDLVIINGVNYYCYELEESLSDVAGIASNAVAICAVPDSENGTESFAVFFAAQNDPIYALGDVVENIRATLRTAFGMEPACVVSLSMAEFPRTDSGKIGRLQLRNQLLNGDFDAHLWMQEMMASDTLTEHCVVYYETNREIDADDLLAALPQLKNKLYIEQLPQLPRRNGGVDVASLYTRKRSIRPVSVDAPATRVERQLVKIWETVLGKANIGVNDNFFDLGGSSLKAIQIISRIQHELHADIGLKDILNGPTPTSLALAINESYHKVFESICPVASQNYFDVSNAQKRLWILSEQEEDHVAYNMFMGYDLKGVLDASALDRAFERIILRHESLRTTFPSVQGEPKQRIHGDGLGFVVTHIDLRGDHDRDRVAYTLAEQEMMSPFDLRNGPLLRAKLLRLEDERHILLFNMHHIISDGWSLKVLFNEVVAAYNAIAQGSTDELPALAIHYKDFSAWHNGLLSSAVVSVHKQYWAEKLNQKTLHLALPTDVPRNTFRTYSGNTKSFALNEQLSASVKDFCTKQNSTLFNYLQAIVKVLLSKYSDQVEISIGTPVASRDHRDLENQIGFYVNYMVLLDDVDDNLKFSDFLSQVKRTTMEAHTHHLYPYDLLVEDMEPYVEAGRNPLYDVMVVMETDEIVLGTPAANRDAFHALTVSDYKVAYPVSKLDITFFFRVDCEITIDIEYRTDLFFESSIDKMAEDFAVLVRTSVDQPRIAVKKLKRELFSSTQLDEHARFEESIAMAISDDF